MRRAGAGKSTNVRLSRITHWLEAQDAVDRVGGPANRAIQRVMKSGPLKDALSGTWFGHPLHPVLVMVPIGSWTSASVLDVMAPRRCPELARRLVGVGVIATLPAVMSGLADWSDTAGSEQRVGVAHATLNSVALSLYAASWWVRGRPAAKAATGGGAAWAGPLLSAAGMAVATAAGYLGGHLIYAQGVGVDTNAFQSGPTDWETVAAVDDLPSDGATAVDARGARLLVAVHDDQIRVLGNRCSHRGGPLSDGEVEGDCVTCPWHASRFHLDTGEVLAGPAVVGQPVYDARVRAGQLEVRRPEVRGLRTSPDGAAGSG